MLHKPSCLCSTQVQHIANDTTCESCESCSISRQHFNTYPYCFTSDSFTLNHAFVTRFFSLLYSLSACTYLQDRWQVSGFLLSANMRCWTIKGELMVVICLGCWQSCHCCFWKCRKNFSAAWLLFTYYSLCCPFSRRLQWSATLLVPLFQMWHYS